MVGFLLRSFGMRNQPAVSMDIGRRKHLELKNKHVKQLTENKSKQDSTHVDNNQTTTSKYPLPFKIIFTNLYTSIILVYLIKGHVVYMGNVLFLLHSFLCCFCVLYMSSGETLGFLNTCY